MGEVFGRYELLRRIGSGGMAEVFVAKTFGAEGFVKDVVIKRILPAFNDDPDFVRMFINEARIAARLQHANIVQIFDFNHVEGTYYIAMEWVDGLDLRSVFNASRRRKLPVPMRVAVHVGMETLKGLHYAHNKTEGGQPLGLVHRDISPHNLLVSFAGEVKIADFGIAKAAAMASATRSGAVKGKLAYMAPEQVRGESLDARSDLFAVGVVLWELLAGRRLYQGASEGELYSRVQQADVRPVRESAPDVPAELDAVVLRMLAARLADRHATAAEALGELSRFAQVGDALDVAAYLRRLLPAEAERERRGQTEVRPMPQTLLGGFVVAPSDASTRTRGAPVVAPSASVDAAGTHGDGAAGQQVYVDGFRCGASVSAQVGPERDDGGGDGSRSTAAPRLPAWIVVGTLASLGASGVLGHWVAARDSAPPADGPTATLHVESKIEGTSLWVDGVRLGEMPVLLEAPPRSRLRLEARRGAAVVGERVVTLTRSGEQVALGSGWIGRDAAASPPVASATTASRTPDSGHAGRAPSAEIAEGPASGEVTLPEKPGRVDRGSALSVGSRQGEWGSLDVVVSPWARVRVDGVDQGQTPLRGLRLSAGLHTVEISNRELERRERVKVKVGGGRQAVVRRNWGY
jgi:tRNA A-37 threonylcarbamoyl transferase component Bud32